jgi:TolA-binding protein
MAAMVATVFPDLATSQSSQSGAFLRAFENPALVRSYLINPQETAYFLMQRFPEMSDVILKNMPFQKIGNHLEPNVYSGLYRHISEEVGRGVRAHDSGVRREMDKLLSSFMIASLGGSSGMETKAYELLRNRIEKPGFNKEAERIEHRIAKLMTSPQARQDLKEAQGLAGLGALPATVQLPSVQPQPFQPQIPQTQIPPVHQPDPRSAIPTSTGGSVNPVDLKPGTVPGIAPIQPPFIPPLPPSTVVPSSVTSSPAIRESIPGGSATVVAPSTVAVAEGTNAKGATPVPPATTSPAPQTPNMISERERMLQDQVAQLQAQLNKQASTPVTPAPVATPAPSADVDQLRQQNKDLNERLAKVEKTLTELASKNAALEQENKELKTKVLELQRQNEELKKSPKLETPPADSPRTEPKKALTNEQIQENEKKLALETKPAAPKAEAPVSAPKENDPAPVIAPVAPPQATPQMKVDPPKMETQVRVTPSSSLPQLVDLLNSGKGDVQEFLLSNKTDLFARTDEEVTKAFRQVNPAKMERFAGSLKYAHTALNTGIVSMDGFTKNDITRLGQVAALAKKVSEETH